MNPELRKRLISDLERVLAPRVLWPSLLALFFLVTLGSWLLRPVPTRPAVLFFLRPGSFSMVGETRPVLPGRGGLEESARNVVEELLLGPEDSQFLPILPRGTRVAEILYRRGRLYVDLSEDAVFAETPSLRDGMSAVKKTLKYNFPTLGNIILTVGGREPYAEGLPSSEKREK